MSRVQFLQMIVMLVAAAILAVIGIVGWVVLVIPAMIFPGIIAGLSLDALAGFGVRKMMQSARKKRAPEVTEKL